VSARTWCFICGSMTPGDSGVIRNTRRLGSLILYSSAPFDTRIRPHVPALVLCSLSNPLGMVSAVNAFFDDEDEEEGTCEYLTTDFGNMGIPSDAYSVAVVVAPVPALRDEPPKAVPPPPRPNDGGDDGDDDRERNGRIKPVPNMALVSAGSARNTTTGKTIPTTSAVVVEEEDGDNMVRRRRVVACLLAWLAGWLLVRLVGCLLAWTGGRKRSRSRYFFNYETPSSAAAIVLPFILFYLSSFCSPCMIVSCDGVHMKSFEASAQPGRSSAMAARCCSFVPGHFFAS